MKQLGDLLDEHVDWEEAPDNENNKKSANGKGGENPTSTYTKEELKKIRDEPKENMISSCTGGWCWHTSAEVQRIIKELTELKMNWRELLRLQIQSNN